MHRLPALIAAALAIACEGDPEPRVIVRWTHATSAAAAPAGIGPEKRVVIAVSEMVASGGGEIVTIDEQIARTIEGPFSGAQLTDHRPLMHDGKILLITKIGKLHALDLAGQTVFTVPSGAPLGQTTPPALTAAGDVRFATTAGQLLGFAADGTEQFRTDLGGAATSPLAIDADGTTYVATDHGHVIGVDGAGRQVFDVQVGGLASGPSIRGDLVTVGDLDGVAGFGTDGVPRFDKPRAARVVGTSILPSQEILVWGEDGILQLLDSDGNTIMRYRSLPDGEANPPPIYATPTAVGADRFGIIDDSGRAHLIDRLGNGLATAELGGTPHREVTVTGGGYVLVAVGNEVKAVDFNAE